MKPEEAEQIRRAVESLFSFKVESPDIWERTLCRVDAEAASEVVLKQWARGVNAPQRRPTLPDLMQAVRSQERLNERDNPAEDQGHSPLIPPDVTTVPTWVRARQVLRAKGDMRAFPEQEPGYRDLGFDWPPPEGVVSDEEYALLMEEVKE